MTTLASELDTLRHLREQVLREVARESQRAHLLHKGKDAGSFAETGRLSMDRRLAYLVEEVGEVGRAIQDVHTARGTGAVGYGALDHLREELIQVAHLAAMWVAVLDLEII